MTDLTGCLYLAIFQQTKNEEKKKRATQLMPKVAPFPSVGSMGNAKPIPIIY